MTLRIRFGGSADAECAAIEARHWAEALCELLRHLLIPCPSFIATLTHTETEILFLS